MWLTYSYSYSYFYSIKVHYFILYMYSFYSIWYSIYIYCILFPCLNVCTIYVFDFHSLFLGSHSLVGLFYTYCMSIVRGGKNKNFITDDGSSATVAQKGLELELLKMYSSPVAMVSLRCNLIKYGPEELKFFMLESCNKIKIQSNIMTSDTDCEELGFLQNENVDGTKF